MWLDLLRYMNDKPPRGKLLALKHMIEADGMDFWFEFSALPYELACHVQRQGESKRLSKNPKIQNYQFFVQTQNDHKIEF